MKKSFISIAALDLLGAVWVGTSWYTGKVAEQEYKTHLEQVKSKLPASPNPIAHLHAKINDLQFNGRSFTDEDIKHVIMNSGIGDKLGLQ
ncbi:DUF945 family protein [Histophilus somni]|uniref:DUF945 family protein n=1 Tax=Histophilus somni TaxID=731 RepID=A0AAX2S0A1_HISSO|nr:DUF945 family protein [Histophilus somni]TDF43966.1 DUF945 family protein [Histophilus somni]TEW30885.1 DUF945 family protein [Histophilus somni]TFF03012.1 DUF945 family protein [Histophilus somni]THA97037.1 DUF945 family protein [Histophilus somni]TJY53889.1 DUF945 domain-containing protein [Histophilus somni]